MARVRLMRSYTVSAAADVVPKFVASTVLPDQLRPTCCTPIVSVAGILDELDNDGGPFDWWQQSTPPGRDEPPPAR